MAEPNGRSPKLFTRVEPDVLERCQRIANVMYDGNMAMMVRIAVKRFIAEQEASLNLVSIADEEAKAAAA